MNKRRMTKVELEDLLNRINNALPSRVISSTKKTTADSEKGEASPEKKGRERAKRICFDKLINKIKGQAMLLVEEDEFDIRVPEGSIEDIDHYVKTCPLAEFEEWIYAIDADIRSFIIAIRASEKASERAEIIITNKNKETRKYVKGKSIGFALLIISLVAGMLIPVVMALTDWAPFEDGENQFGELVGLFDGLVGMIGFVIERISDYKKSNIDADADRKLIGRT